MIYQYKSSKFLKYLCSIVEKSGSFKLPIVEREKLGPEPFKQKGLTKNNISGLDVYSIHSKSEHIFIYLHGGAYLLGIDNFNIGFMKSLQKKTKSNVYIIDYPLAPKHKVNEVVELTYNTVNEIIIQNKNSKIHLVGDSAGGGLALPIFKRLEKANLVVDNLILLSPWLDVSMSNSEIDDYKDLDVILDKEDLINCGNLYSDDLPKGLEASPIYDDYKEYENITMFVGTHDMLYPDVVKFNDLNKKTDLHIFDEAPHGFMLFPFTKEKRIVIEIINDIISKTNSYHK